MTKTKLISLVLLLSALAAFTACASDGDSEVLAADARSVSTSTTATSTYFIARQDQRRCSSPMCGGLWVRRVNQATTKCADGVYRAECYVAETSYATALRYDAIEHDFVEGRLRAGLMLVRGSVAARSFGDLGNLGVLKVTEAWDAWTDQAPLGTLHAVSSTGIVCLSAPCPTLKATQLNRSIAERQITDLDLAALAAAEETKAEMLNLAYSDRLLVAGEIEACPGNHVVAHASQVFKRVEHKLVVDVTGDWRHTSSDRSRYNYTFGADGSFKATQEPGCLFAHPACAVKMALLEGTYVVDGEALHIVYTSAVRNGESADFVVSGEGTAMRLVGDDFGTHLRLRRLGQ